jgi:alanine-glyoxylate transaminase / serine-glyoxylate transaminase / serine-pyruvate transaminase
VTVTGMKVPASINDAKLRNQLLDEFNIEIGGGFGPLKGKLWRVGLMGYGCQKQNVLLFLAAFEKCLIDQGFRLSAGAGVGAAIRNYADAHAAVAVHK